MDFFDGPGTITQDMLNYVSYTGTQRGSNEQKIIEGSVSGKLFDIPGGGPVGLAAGAQFDREDAGLPARSVPGGGRQPRRLGRARPAAATTSSPASSRSTRRCSST